MTDPTLAVAPVAPPPAPEPRGPVVFPIAWVLTHAAAPIRYRALREVALLADAAREVAALPYTFAPAIELMLAQQPDGTWNQAMLAVPGARAQTFEGVGTIQAIRRLLEYGWDKESPPLMLARRMLFRLLAEDDDPSVLFGLGVRGKPDEDATRF